MSRIKKLADLSSKDKVIHFLQNSKHCPTMNSLSMLSKSPANNSFAFQHRLRSCSENDSISTSSSSSSSVVDELSQSSLSDPIAHCSITSSNVSSSSEELDFNIGFDQISEDYNDADDDDDYPHNSSKNNADAATLQGENLIDTRLNEFDEIYHPSSDSTSNKYEHDFNHDDDNLRKHATFLHDSTHTLCSGERFSLYTSEDDDDNGEDNEQITGIGIRSNSMSSFQFNGKPTALETAPKKIVRFADMMGLDLESIRYMSPPDQTISPMIQECVRVQFGQVRPGKYLLDLPNIARRTQSFSSSTKQYNLVSRNFLSPTNIIPIIYDNQVLLECLYTKDSSAYGTIRVHNCDYHKKVFIRLTDDEWKTCNDIEARHSMNYSHDNTDTFAFEIKLPKSSCDSLETKRILFAICFQAMQQDFWDNNQGWNYVLDVFEKR